MKDGTKIIVRQTRSHIGREPNVRQTLRALGLGRIGKQREITLYSSSRGMIRTVESIVEIVKQS